MAAYVIGYDLKKPGKDYAQIIDAIKRICPTWCHPLDSTWFVEYSGTAVQLRDQLLPHIDGNDKLFVGRVTNAAAWYGLGDKVTDWLKSVLNRQPA